MRILVVHNSSTIGGAELSMLEFLAAARHSTGYQFSVACPGESLFGKQAQKLGIRVYAIDLVAFRRPRGILAYFATLLSAALANFSILGLLLQYRPDIIHANNTSSFVQSVFAARLGGIPIIWHIRDSQRLPRSIGFLERWASGTIAVSLDVAQKVLQRPNRAVIVYNGLKLTRSPEIVRPGGEQKADYDIITVAQFAPWKRHAVTIEVVAELYNRGVSVSAALVGAEHHACSQTYLEDLKQKVSSLGLQNQIHFLPHTEHIHDLIRNARVLLHPAIDEPMGRAVAEAMLLGVPVVASRSGGIPEFIQDGIEGLLVAPTDVSAFAKAVIEMFDDRRRHQLVVNARQRALTVFDIERQTSAVLSVYHEAGARGRQPHRDVNDFGLLRNSANTFPTPADHS